LWVYGERCRHNCQGETDNSTKRSRRRIATPATPCSSWGRSLTPGGPGGPGRRVPAGAVPLPELVRQLDAAGLPARDVSVRRPTLDEVFRDQLGARPAGSAPEGLAAGLAAGLPELTGWGEKEAIR